MVDIISPSLPSSIDNAKRFITSFGTLDYAEIIITDLTD